MYDQLVANSIFRAEIKEILENDGSKLQQVLATGYAGEELKMIRGQTFGISSRPPVGSLGWAFAINGRRENAFMLGGEMPGKRFTDQHGEGGITLYDAEGNHVTLNRTTVKIKAGGSEIEMNVTTGAVKVKSAGNLEVEAPGMKFRNTGGAGGGTFQIGADSSSQVDLGGTGGKRIRLEDGSVTTNVRAT